MLRNGLLPTVASTLLLLASCEAEPLPDPALDASVFDADPADLGDAASAAMDSSFRDADVIDATSLDTGNPVDPAVAMEVRFLEAKAEPSALRRFLLAMPKGGDLHTHLSGAPRAESLVGWGADDGLCVSQSGAVARGCAGDDIPLAEARSSATLLSQIVAAWSLEGFQGSLLERHAHFFSTFGRFRNITSTHPADMLVEMRRTAAAQNVSYVEPMMGLETWRAANLSGLVASNAGWDDTVLEAGRAALIANTSFGQALAITSAFLDATESEVNTKLGCSTASPEAACDVEVRYLVQTHRATPRHELFAEFIYGFELAKTDRRVVGVNMVQPEEDFDSLANYDDHMIAIGFLVRRAETLGEPEVKVALHAGELVPAVLPSNQQHHTRFHIRRAVEVARAHRIGHGADIFLEDEGPGQDPDTLFEEMAARGVLVEACLTSNDQLLGLSATSHPLKEYLRRGVPVALATDDEGVLRTDLTTEFQRAAQEHDLSYAVLKRMARDSLEHAFIDGESLWASRAELRFVDGCANVLPEAPPPADCQNFLESNQRARLQWNLERALVSFETEQLR